jgi:hypothetical protein
LLIRLSIRANDRISGATKAFGNARADALGGASDDHDLARSVRHVYSSLDEIHLVNHTSGLPASDADEYAFVNPAEAVGPGLDLD